MSKHHGMHVHRIRDWEQRGRDDCRAGKPIDKNPAKEAEHRGAYARGWNEEARHAGRPVPHHGSGPHK